MINENELKVQETFANQRSRNGHSRYICVDGGNIYTLYVRYFTFKNTRLFQAINMFQCEKCGQFYFMEKGSHNLIPLEVKRKEIKEEKK